MAVWVAWGTCFAVRSPALVWEVCGCSADDTLRKFRHDLAGIEAARRKAQDDLDAAEEGVEELVANSELSSREKERVLASAMLDGQSLTRTIAALTRQVGRINGCVAAIQGASLARVQVQCVCVHTHTLVWQRCHQIVPPCKLWSGKRAQLVAIFDLQWATHLKLTNHSRKAIMHFMLRLEPVHLLSRGLSHRLRDADCTLLPRDCCSASSMCSYVASVVAPRLSGPVTPSQLSAV